MGLSLKRGARAALRSLTAIAAFTLALAACRSREEHATPSAGAAPASATGPSSPLPSPSPAAPTAEQAPSPALGPRSPEGASPATAPSPRPEGTSALAPDSSFLVGTPGESVSLRSLDGQTRSVVPSVSSWVYDPSHGLLWFLDEDRFGVADLRNPGPPAMLAAGVPEVGSIWVEWPESNAVRFVRRETGCEETGDAVELKVRSKPVLRLVEADRRRSLSREGVRWVAQQVKRAEFAPPPAESLDSEARRVALPKGWSGCDDADRCGLSAAFGKGSLRLVLVRDNLGADCFHLGCLLYDPAADRFASPPVLVDEGGTPSLGAEPPRWTSDAKDAVPGSCGPYLFDTTGSAFLAHRFLCTLGGSKRTGTCQELPGEGIGWLRPGVIAGSPG